MPISFPTPLQLLIVEDNPVDARMLRDLLVKSPWGNFEFFLVRSLQKAFYKLERQRFDVCLLDLNLEDSYGLETLQKVYERFSAVPIVVVSGAYTESMGLKVLTNGAQDFLLKGSYTPYSLAKSLYYAIERKKSEEALQAAYRKLKDTQAQLIEAEKSNVVGTIATGVAHEVKNPLATIIYGVEYLKSAVSSDNEKVDHTLQCIKDAAYRANDIIRDLLEFGNTAPLKFTETDIQIVIERAMNLVKPQCDQKHITIQTVFSNNLPKVRVDSRRIEQVIINVFLNAIHAMSNRGEMAVVTRWMTFSDEEIGRYRELGVEANLNKAMVVVEIDDNGSGLDPEHIDKVFDPFFTTRRGKGGVGLGLSISRLIMRNHNGFIVLENRSEGGCRVRLGFTS